MVITRIESRLVILTIVTVAKNNAIGLRTTYESATKQNFPFWEMRIVVGDSKDNTLEIAQNIARNDSRVSYLVDNGHGIYSAMNQGLLESETEFIWFMNSGDVFYNPESIQIALQKIVSGNFAVVIGGYKVMNGKKRNYQDKELSTVNIAYSRRGLCHQSMIFKLEILKNQFGYNTEYDFGSDFDLIMKISTKYRIFRINQILSEIEPFGSADMNLWKVHCEKHKIRQRYLPGPLWKVSSFVWAFLALTKLSVKNLIIRARNS